MSGRRNYWQQAVSPREYAFGLAGGMIITAAAAFVFYNSPKALILGILIIPFWMRMWDDDRQKIKQAAFEQQLQKALMILSSSLEAGHSLENATAETYEELVRDGSKETMVGHEFAIMSRGLSMNLTVEQCWETFARRCGQTDVAEFAMVIKAGKRSGANLIEVTKKCARQIADKLDVKREIDTVLTSKRFELKVLLVMPWVILLYMRMVFSGMTDQLYRNPAGILVMTLCLVVYAAAAVWGRKIIDIRV